MIVGAGQCCTASESNCSDLVGLVFEQPDNGFNYRAFAVESEHLHANLDVLNWNIPNHRVRNEALVQHHQLRRWNTSHTPRQRLNRSHHHRHRHVRFAGLNEPVLHPNGRKRPRNLVKDLRPMRDDDAGVATFDGAFDGVREDYRFARPGGRHPQHPAVPLRKRGTKPVAEVELVGAKGHGRIVCRNLLYAP